MIYSFLTIMDLMNKISRLNKEEKEFLVSKECVLDQKRILRIKFENGNDKYYFSQLKYYIKLATGVQMQIKRFNTIDRFIFEYILEEFPFKVKDVC